MNEPINLVDPDLYATGDPFRQWRWLRANAPVYRHPETDLPPFWALTTYDDVRAVYRDAARFSSAGGILLRPADHGTDPGGGRTLALTDAPRHRQLRGLVDRWFTVRAVRSIEAKLDRITRQVVAAAVERGECDFVTDLAGRVPLFVICEMMGIPESDWEPLYGLTSQAFGAGEPAARRLAHLSILSYFDELRAAKARDPGDDLVSALVTAEIDGAALTPDDIILNCDNLLVGGTENTRIAAAGGMLALLAQPDQWAALVADPDLMPTAVEEVLRWTSTATHIMRTATAPVLIRDVTVPAGDRVTLWLPSANRDEAAFDDPDRFDIRRRPNRHTTLGLGEHFCVGNVLARVELSLLYRALAPVHVELTAEPTWLRSIIVNGPERMRVCLTPRNSHA